MAQPITKEQAQKILDEQKGIVYHKTKGEGTVEMARIDKLNNNRIKAEIMFTELDLLEEIKKPAFLFLDDPILSLEPWE